MDHRQITVVVPVKLNGARAAERLRRAAEFCRRNRARAVLVHVLRVTQNHGYGLFGQNANIVRRQLVSMAQEDLITLERHMADSGADCVSVVVEGTSVADEILRAAARHQATHIIMGGEGEITVEVTGRSFCSVMAAAGMARKTVPAPRPGIAALFKEPLAALAG